jgi:hypothetical protein
MRYLNLNAKTGFILGIVTFLFYFDSNAQVTIGMDVSPEKAALLQLKDKQASPNSKEATATTGGFLLPRVELAGTKEFTLIPGLTNERKKDHTGLLVYNLKVDANLQLEKGVYQWNGEEWRVLQKTTKTEGVAVKKKVYRAKKPDETAVVSLGIFEFRIVRLSNNRSYSQLRLPSNLSLETIHVLINWDRDRDIDNESVGWPASGNNPDFYFGIKTFSPPFGTWDTIWELTGNAEQHEIWLSDLKNDNIYHVQFFTFGSDDANEDKMYGIIAQKY